MRTRKALSTVIGAVFAIIALTSTITYISYSMGILDNYNQSVLTKNQQLTDTNKEKFQISSVTVNQNKLNITVTNTGNLPIKFTKIWVQNTTTPATSTSWDNAYVPTNNFVAPGSTLTNIGQNTPVSINPVNSYNVKLVTSRGNTQQIAVSSASATKLNIQLIFLPPTVSSGFTSQLLMVVINNSTNTLINISPSSLPLPTYGINNSGNLQCASSVVSPARYDTLAPGNAAFFTWTITASKGNPTDTCTYNLTQPLQNGYLQTVSPSAPLTISAVTLSSTTYALNSGIVSMDYTSFKWIDTNQWKNDWQFPATTDTAFQVNFTNNNQTSGGYYLNMSQNSQILLTPTLGNTASSAHVPFAFFIVGSVNANSNPYTLTSYADYSQGIANQGGTKVLYFGAVTAGGFSQSCNGNNNNCIPPGQYYGLLILYGKYTKAHAFTGGTYAQTLPFMAVVAGP